jgi:hypothetical protein
MMCSPRGVLGDKEEAAEELPVTKKKEAGVDVDGGEVLLKVLMAFGFGKTDEEVEEVEADVFPCSGHRGGVHGDGGEGRRGEFLSVGFFFFTGKWRRWVGRWRRDGGGS